MKMLTTKTKIRWAIAVAAAVLLGLGYAGARHWAWPALKAHRIARMNGQAAAFLAAGDLPNAMLMARRSLQSSMANAPAWRLAAQTATARDSAESVGYQDYLSQLEPTRENRLELMRLGVRYNALANAARAAEALAATSADDAEYHTLALQLYRRMGKAPEIRRHLAALARLRPDDATVQFEIAELDLLADPGRTDADVRPRLAALAARPALRARALSLLLRESMAAQRTDEVRGWARQLRTVPDLDGPQRLELIEALFMVADPGAAGELARIQNASRESGPDAAAVIALLTRSGHPREGFAWFAALPETTRRHDEAQQAAAEALLGLGDWPALGRHLRGPAWGEREYFRQMLLARVARAEGRDSEFAQAWKAALIAGGGDAPRAFALLARTEAWGWKAERHDVVWKLFALLPTHEAVRRALIAWERAQGNTANLHKIFTRIAEVSPDDLTARNNLAYTGLLLDTNLGQAGQAAAALAAAEPANPYFATTHALALYKQGNARAALARLDALRPVEKMVPERLLLSGLFAAFAGEPERAADLLDGAVLQGVLPEERALVAQARAELARLAAGQGNSDRLQRLRAGGSQVDGGWLALMDRETREAATTEMQLADSLYAAGDWPALGQILRAGSWRQDDYLRVVLAAYVARQRGEPAASQQEWRQALALADRRVPRVRNLERLTAAWAWAPERLATLNALFERDPADRALLAALLEHYRAAKRTAELVRVLDAHVANAPAPGEESVALAYYSLLRELGVARAHVTARNAYAAQPAAPSHRFVYAFSLWKQRRAPEAVALVEAALPDGAATIVPVALLRAAILAETGAAERAREQLAAFDPAQALPEEAALAVALARKLTPAGS